MSFNERIDVVDLVLKVLKEHERTLDSIVSQLSETVSAQAVTPEGRVTRTHRVPRYRVVIHTWSEFRRVCEGSDLVAFDVEENKLKVSALKSSGLYIYSEPIPSVSIRIEDGNEKAVVEGEMEGDCTTPSSIFSGKLRCGLGVRAKRVPGISDRSSSKINYSVNPDEARQWLSKELEIDENSIVYGSMDL